MTLKDWKKTFTNYEVNPSAGIWATEYTKREKHLWLSWRLDNKGRVYAYDDYRHPYVVSLFDIDEDKQEILGTFKTKSLALKFMKKYMEKN